MKMRKIMITLLLAVCMLLAATTAALAATTPVDTLAELKTAFASSGTVVLNANIDLGTDTLIVDAGISIVLDLNGNTISKTDSSNGAACLIENNGTLTVTDHSSSQNGKLSFKTTTPSATNSYASNVISNNGMLTIGGGTIENTSGGGACYAVDNYAGSTLNVKGGNLKAEYTTVRAYSWANDPEKITLNISGGTITSQNRYAVQTFTTGTNANVELNISGNAVITTNDSTYNLALYFNTKGNAEKLKANISGGTINGQVALNGKTSTTMKQGNFSITGGTMGGVTCYDTPACSFISGGEFGIEPDDSFIVPGADAVKIGNKWYIGTSIPVTPEAAPSVPKTGDETPLMAMALLMLLSVGAFVVLNKRKCA